MCTNPDKFWQLKGGFNFSCLERRIKRFHDGKEEFLEDYRDVFDISGGEPTLSPHLIPLSKKINQLFPDSKIRCLTNGRNFFYAGYAENFLKKIQNKFELIIPIHGHTPKLHDSITRVPGSFLQTVKGLKNIFQYKKHSHHIEIRIIIHKQNYKFLKEILLFLKNNFSKIDRVVFMFFEVEGQAKKNITKLKVSYSKISPYLRKILPYLHSFSDIRFYHFPLCVLPIVFFPHTWRTLPESDTIFLKQCQLCSVKAFCLGIPITSMQYMQIKEFQPIRDNLMLETTPYFWHHPIKKIPKQYNLFKKHHKIFK